MWNPRKMLLLHNSRETLAWFLNRRIRHLCTTYRRKKCNDFYPKYAIYVWFPVFLSRWSDMTILCNVYDAMALAYKLLALSFSLLKSLFFFLICMATLAQCTNQDSNCVYAGTILWHNGWYDTNMIWYVCNGRCRSLMCTSNVAGNTQMASLDKQVTQNGLRG